MDISSYIEVQEITLGISIDDDIRAATERMICKINENSLILPSPAVSFDIKKRRFTLHDAYRLAGLVPVPSADRPAASRPSPTSTKDHPELQQRHPRRKSRSKSKVRSRGRTPYSAPPIKKVRRGYTSTPMESTPAPNLEHASISSVLTPPDDGNLLRSETMSRSNPNPGKDTLTKFTLWRNPRAVSIIHSVGDLDLNTTDHFKNVASLV